jgi:hypothetical protein
MLNARSRGTGTPSERAFYTRAAPERALAGIHQLWTVCDPAMITAENGGMSIVGPLVNFTVVVAGAGFTATSPDG